jgi:hypothetical protein
LRLHLSAQRAPTVDKLRVPQEFVKAWLHCVSFFISLGTQQSNSSYRQHHDKCLRALIDGRLDLVKLFCSTKLAKAESAPTIVIATKLCHRLLQVISSYWTYVGQLVSLLFFYIAPVVFVHLMTGTEIYHRLDLDVAWFRFKP